jgi:hypothetical protein
VKGLGALLAALLALVLFPREAAAHKPSDSYLTVTMDGRSGDVRGRWDIAIHDLAYALALDDDGDGKITWGELSAHQEEIASYATARLSLRSGEALCPIQANASASATSLAIATHSDGSYAVLRFEGRCPTAPSPLVVDYRLFFDIDPQHRGLLRLESGTSRTHVFSAQEPVASFDLEASGKGQQLATVVKAGVVHIWLGYDHVLFLLALLLPSVLRRLTLTREEHGPGWVPVDRLRTALLDVLRIVTAFTLAHSITLSLAALGVVTLPSRLVESAIAASVVLAAANNLHPILREDRWAAAFLLGLMHGFGFSATLMDLDLPRANLLLTLFGFNLGVEIGQLAIVAVFVPLAFALRRSVVYRRGLLAGGSLLILILASVWFVERAFAVKILS